VSRSVMSLFKNDVARIDYTGDYESRAFFSPVCRSFSSPRTFLMTVFCFYPAMHFDMLAHLLLDVFLYDSVAFCLSIFLISLFLTYDFMDLRGDGVMV
jgi:hypothetical protein